MLGDESETVEVHRFGHWGPGWFEIIIVDPSDSERVEIATDIENRLEDYPILDETDFSEREWNEKQEYWDNCSMWDRIELCVKAGESIFASRSESIPGDVWKEIHIDC
jgi:hypothetical protein